MINGSPENIKYVTPETTTQKFKNIIDNLGNRTGPNVIWLKEQEDDSKIRYVEKNFTDGIPTINQTLCDFTSGLLFIAGRANHGKSTWLINLMNSAIKLNDDLIIVDISLDDPPKKRYMQHVACIASLQGQNLKYSQISNEASINIDRKKAALARAKDTFFQSIKDERLHLLESSENIDNKRISVRDYRTIILLMRQYRARYPKNKIAFNIDAWNNLDCSLAKPGSELQQGNQVLEALKQASEENEIMCLISAHIRKTTEKIITIQDIKGTSNIEYDAVCSLILRNEYRESILSEPLMYEMENRELPIFSIQVVKSKVGEWDYPLFYPADTGSCFIQTLHPAEYREFYEIYRGKRK
jgi:hypothetical protein